MRSLLYLTVILVTIACSLVSCSSKPSLEKYFVNSSDQKNFMTLDIAPSFIKADSLNLSAPEKEALKSLKKLNVLIYKKDSLDPAKYDGEREKVKNILKDEQYEQLMKFGSSGKGASLTILEEGKSINEFVIFMYEKDNGFGVIRVLGEDMNPNNILTLAELIQKVGINQEELKPLMNIWDKGPKGSKGDKGEKGEKGPKGDKGEKGEK